MIIDPEACKAVFLKNVSRQGTSTLNLLERYYSSLSALFQHFTFINLMSETKSSRTLGYT
jgi:hypothetical protein